METVEKINIMQEISERWRSDGHTIACVPTMGFLHEGHIELLRVGRRRGDRLVMTLFVNPTQFGPHEDYAGYPRNTQGDLKKARSVGVDVVFMPTAEEMYPEGYQTTITVGEITRYLCGRSRPGHFAGVTTVVAKLFHITKPHLAIFGEKDYQQIVVIRQMVRDLNMGIEIIGVPTIREEDGLAMSSRNTYLSPEERQSALSLKRGLDLAQIMIKGGKKDTATIVRALKDLILSYPSTEIDYINICDPVRLVDVETIDRPCLLALAVRVGKARLIDNVILGEQ
jgi:pantoate--beta-alanine ligase